MRTLIDLSKRTFYYINKFIFHFELLISVMVKSSVSCDALPTNAKKVWLYDEYYVGERDGEGRKNGRGENHWTGAESIEWYSGRLTRDTMHGLGDYRWRHRGPDGAALTYEGFFYANCMHGYGTMSYPNGRVFSGLFDNDLRWGPGVQYHTTLHEDVGFWSGSQLVRLVWRPAAPSVAPDLVSGQNKYFVEPYRVKLTETSKVIGETNSAIELLKQNGADPRWAAEKWSKLYPTRCTDMQSALCHVDVFDNAYYRGKISALEETAALPAVAEEALEDSSQNSAKTPGIGTYFAWNNNEAIIHMMKHCFKHERQRQRTGVDIAKILNGPRRLFRPPGKHERDCRTLLMASYLGHWVNVAQLINEEDVHPDVADVQGNSAVMYATCGNHAGIIHFLVEAGARVDSFNDACCTPLGVALMRYTCATQDIQAGAIPLVMLPRAMPTPGPPPVTEQTALEWNINRDLPAPEPNTALYARKSLSKTVRSASAKKIKSSMTLRSPSVTKSKKDLPIPKPVQEQGYDSDESFSEEKRLYTTVHGEYLIKVNDLFAIPSALTPYMYEIRSMKEEIDALDEMPPKKLDDKKDPKKATSKVLKPAKPSKEVIWQSTENDDYRSVSSFEKIKLEMLSRMMLTIRQLLADGADPKLVRFPQPALFTAVTSCSSDLVRDLVRHGADINEVYPATYNYTALDVAISRPFTPANLEMIRALLDSGADTNHRLDLGIPEPTDPPRPEQLGPTLLHAVLARKTEFGFDEEIRCQIMELLLKYNCCPTARYKERSAIDVAMTKKMDYIDIFIKSSNVDVNSIINGSNQSILVKMFSLDYFRSVIGADRFSVLTNLLLYGADPFLECQNGDEKYENVFELAKVTLEKIAPGKLPAAPAVLIKPDLKSKSEMKGKTEKSKSVVKGVSSSKSMGKVEEFHEYRESLDLITECGRLLHIRWLQAKLMKELIDVVNKFRHRPWITVLKEHKNKKSCGLWLTTQRCLEIWDVLKTAKRTIYTDSRIQRTALCMIHFYHLRSKDNVLLGRPVTAVEKGMVESDVFNMISEHRAASKLAHDAQGAGQRPYVKPELTSSTDRKYNVCFECAVRLQDDNVRCCLCKLVSFCSMACIEMNIGRAFCHPCSDYLKNKYFPSTDRSDDI